VAAEDLHRSVELRKKLLRRLVWKAPLIIALMAFAVWWQSQQEAKKNSPGKSPVVSAEIAQRLTGSWQAEVNYPGGGKFTEQFLFQPEGSMLFGTVSYLAFKHGIEEGRIDGENISFFIRFNEAVGDVNREHKTYYWGTFAGGQMHLRVQDDRGNQPVEFSLTKIDANEQRSLPRQP
jgi:hypothetical protein